MGKCDETAGLGGLSCSAESEEVEGEGRVLEVGKGVEAESLVARLE